MCQTQKEEEDVEYLWDVVDGSGSVLECGCADTIEDAIYQISECADLRQKRYYYCGVSWEDVRATLRQLGIGRSDPSASS